MLALAVSFLAALYLLGPDLLSRWMVSWVAPRRGMSANRGEQITQALIWAVVPLMIAVPWANHDDRLAQFGSRATVDNVYVCLSGTCSGADRTNFVPALGGFVRINFAILWREYLIVAVLVTFLLVLIGQYGRIRDGLGRLPQPYRSQAQNLLGTLVSSLILDWHVWLSRMLTLPGNDVVVDVLTKSGVLYQGRLTKKVLGADGALVVVQITQPRRFERDAYHEARKEDPKVGEEAFWHTIPGSVFLIQGTEIANINVFYVPKQIAPPASEMTAEDREKLAEISRLVKPDWNA